VQVGVFLSEDLSQGLVQELRAQGFRAQTKKEGTSDSTIHRVLTGPYASEAEARKAVEELRSMGYDAFLPAASSR
jgi:cell division septation protein DedD